MGNIIAKSKRDWSPLLVLFLAVLGLTALSLMSHGELDLLNLFVIPVLFSLFLLLWFWGYYRVIITDEDVVIKEYRIFKRKKECYRYAQLDGYYDVEEVYKKKDGTNFVVERLWFVKDGWFIFAVSKGQYNNWDEIVNSIPLKCLGALCISEPDLSNCQQESQVLDEIE